MVTTVKLPLLRLNEIKASLDKLLTAELPAKTAYRLSKFAKKVLAEQKHMSEIRIKLFKTLGNEVVKGSDKFQLAEANIAEYNRQIEDLYKEEVEFEVATVTLEDIESAKLSAADMANLDFIIDEPN